MPAPHEIIAAPYTIFLAPTGTTFPDIDEAPGAFDPGWFQIGTSGDKDYTDDGVTVSHPQSTEVFRGAGSAVARKIFRTEEDLLIGFTLADLSVDQYAEVLDRREVTEQMAGGGSPGTKSFGIARGLIPVTWALLARGKSTEDNDLNSQYEVDVVSQDGEPAPVFTKGEPAGLELQFRALDTDGDGEIGTLVVQTAEASG